MTRADMQAMARAIDKPDRPLHVHTCAVCGTDWQCSCPGCEPNRDDTCVSCATTALDAYMTTRFHQAAHTAEQE
jgi:hypothetical protein